MLTRMDKIRRGNVIPGGQFPMVYAIPPGDGIECVTRPDSVVARLFSTLDGSFPLRGRSKFSAPPYQKGHTDNANAIAEASTH